MSRNNNTILTPQGTSQEILKNVCKKFLVIFLVVYNIIYIICWSVAHWENHMLVHHIRKFAERCPKRHQNKGSTMYLTQIMVGLKFQIPSIEDTSPSIYEVYGSNWAFDLFEHQPMHGLWVILTEEKAVGTAQFLLWYIETYLLI